jgi:hypothetical protein
MSQIKMMVAARPFSAARFILVGALCVAAIGTAAIAQESGRDAANLVREGFGLSKTGAEQLEAQLKDSPDDLAVRAKLLGFYARGALQLLGQHDTIEARRRHILWLIEHHPESQAAGLSEATIDRAGHNLADAEGYEQASKLWIVEATLHETSAAVQGNAAKFFQLSDKARAIAFLTQAEKDEPNNPAWSAEMGYVSALALLGVQMINSNGLPLAWNAAEAQSEFATRLLDQLKASSDPVTLSTAGMIVGQYGMMLSAMYRNSVAAVDFKPMAEALLARGAQIHPDPRWASMLEELHKLWGRAGQDK